MTPEQRSSLRAHVLATALAGDTATPRPNVVNNVKALASDDPDKTLGLGRRGRDAVGIMRAVADLCGCSASLDEREGPGFIDPERLLDGLEGLGVRLAQAAARAEYVLIATGHPTGLLTMYQRIARSLRAAGAEILTPLDDVVLDPPKSYSRRRVIRYLDGVGVLATPGDLLHSHDSWPMAALLDQVGTPDLVVADHGFAGEAIARGMDVVSFTDVNDPAIAVAWADGMTKVVVPLDDNRAPRLYDPLAGYLESRIAERS